MASQVVMPKMSDTMEEGVVVKWLKREGEPVQPGDALAEIETDKAVLELEASAPGVLRKILVPEDGKVPVGKLIAVIGAQDEDISALTGLPGAAFAVPAAPVAASSAEQQPVAPRATTRTVSRDTRAQERIDASPLARRMAEEAGIDIAQVRGTGPDGRVVKRDIEAFIAQRSAAPSQREPAPAPIAPPWQPTSISSQAVGVDYEDQDLSMMRRTIAKRMMLSKATTPHFYVTTEIDMGQAIVVRESLNDHADDDAKISFNDMILKAAANALRQSPRLNVSYTAEEKLRIYHRVHIGMVVALDEGLIIPVIRDCDRKSVGEIAREARGLAQRARTRRLRPEEYTGSTFSVSNLGMFDIEYCEAIINPPEAAILGVGAIRERPVVVGGQLGVGHRMNVTLSCDHRIVDGAAAAQFLQIFKRLLEEPLKLML